MVGLDPLFLANSKFNRRKFDECIEVCEDLLAKNPYDQAAWFLKCRALTSKNWIDDTEIEDEGIAEILLDDNATAQLPRPGTSMQRPLTSSNAAGQANQGVRPVTNSGRPLTGFLRPGTGARPGTTSRPETGRLGTGRLGTGRLGTAIAGSRPGTSRPVTSSGRHVRLGTQSLLSGAGDTFIDVHSLDFSKYIQRPALAKALCDFIIYHDHFPTKAIELASLATKAVDYKDWWWKARLGKCFYQIGLYRDSEKQFLSAIKEQEMVSLYLELCKVYVRLDQPNTALETYVKAAERFPGDTSLILGVARIYDVLNDVDRALQYYRKVLHFEATNVEAIACLASHSFYTDQPEIALRYYRRLLQVGVSNTELWNNIALCCFYASQYDMALYCFDRALQMGEDDSMADIWYNIGQVAISIGDLGLAYQAFKIAISFDHNHAEAFNNLGVLELRKNNVEQARAHFATAANLTGALFEPYFNSSLLSFKLGDFQESFSQINKSLTAYADFTEAKELLKQLQDHFTTLQN